MLLLTTPFDQDLRALAFTLVRLKAGATFTPLERERLILNYSVKKVTRTKKEQNPCKAREGNKIWTKVDKLA